MNYDTKLNELYESINDAQDELAAFAQGLAIKCFWIGFFLGLFSVGALWLTVYLCEKAT